VLWAKLQGYPYWPAIIYPEKRGPQRIMREGGYTFVRFFGTHQFGYVENTLEWDAGKERCMREAQLNEKRKPASVRGFKPGVAEAEAEIADPSPVEPEPEEEFFARTMSDPPIAAAQDIDPGPIEVTMRRVLIGKFDAGATIVCFKDRKITFIPGNPVSSEAGYPMIVLPVSAMTRMEVDKQAGTLCLWGHWDLPFGSAFGKLWMPFIDHDDPESSIYMEFTPNCRWPSEILCLSDVYKAKTAFTSGHRGRLQDVITRAADAAATATSADDAANQLQTLCSHASQLDPGPKLRATTSQVLATMEAWDARDVQLYGCVSIQCILLDDKCAASDDWTSTYTRAFECVLKTLAALVRDVEVQEYGALALRALAQHLGAFVAARSRAVQSATTALKHHRGSPGVSVACTGVLVAACFDQMFDKPHDDSIIAVVDAGVLEHLLEHIRLVGETLPMVKPSSTTIAGLSPAGILVTGPIRKEEATIVHFLSDVLTVRPHAADGLPLPHLRILARLLCFNVGWGDRKQLLAMLRYVVTDSSEDFVAEGWEDYSDGYDTDDVEQEEEEEEDFSLSEVSASARRNRDLIEPSDMADPTTNYQEATEEESDDEDADADEVEIVEPSSLAGLKRVIDLEESSTRKRRAMCMLDIDMRAATARSHCSAQVETRFRALCASHVADYLADKIDMAEMDRRKAACREQANREHGDLASLEAALANYAAARATHESARKAEADAKGALEVVLDKLEAEVAEEAEDGPASAGQAGPSGGVKDE